MVRRVAGASFAGGEHRRVDVSDGDGGGGGVVDGVGVVEEAEGDVPSPTGDIEDCPALGGGRAVGCGQRGAGGAGIEGAYEVVFPEAVDA